MYDFAELETAHDEWWSGIRHHLIGAGVVDAPQTLTRRLDHVGVWTHPHLLLGQGCEYPLAKSFAHCVRMVATPCYAAVGCDGANYRSAIVVRDDDPAGSLAEMRGRRCVVNQTDSNSGMNLLRATVAPLSYGGRFFGSVAISGSHRRSAEMVTEGAADVAALDCVSFALLRQLHPESVATLRVVQWSVSTPSLPFITAAGTSDAVLRALREALAAALADRSLDTVRERLLLTGFDFAPAGGYYDVLRLERRATELGYAALC
jgi:ABC-type phosphate/phosphonate transport system substrate-binding protein